MDSSAIITARWTYIRLWAEAMQYWYGSPPSCPSWLEFAFYCYYGSDNSTWPDPEQRNTGNGPDMDLIQSCALALLDGPDVLIRITERREMHTYAEDIETAPETSHGKIIKGTLLCKHFMTGVHDDRCVLNGRYKMCPFTGDKSACDLKGFKDEQ